MHEVIIAIDEGTTNAKAIAVDRDGIILAKGSTAIEVINPKPAYCEQNPLTLIEAVRSSITDMMRKLTDVKIVGLGISNQRESIVVWDRETGMPLSPVILWQCHRSEQICEEIKSNNYAELVQKLSGLPIDPLFSASKIKWVLDRIDQGYKRAETGKICFGTIDSWLVWNLTAGECFVTDVSNASRTQLLNIHTVRWDEQLNEIFGIPPNGLAEIESSSGERAKTSKFSPLPDGIPILSQIGDSHSALYGQAGFYPGIVKATYGTGSSLMTPVEKVDTDIKGLAATIAWHDGELSYALEGNISHTGAAMGFIAKLLRIDNIDELAKLVKNTDRTDGVFFVPALSGLSAPHWNSKARGLISGLTDYTEPKHLALAALQAIAFQIADVFHLMEKILGNPLNQLFVDGGPTQNYQLLQFQADLINRPVVKSQVSEASALGAAYLAGKALNWWSTRDAIASLERKVEIVEPNPSRDQVIEDYRGWQDAIRRVMLG